MKQQGHIRNSMRTETVVSSQQDMQSTSFGFRNNFANEKQFIYILPNSLLAGSHCLNVFCIHTAHQQHPRI